MMLDTCIMEHVMFVYANKRSLFVLYLAAGNYIYFETSSPVQTGDNAKLELNSPGGSACLTFYYHMYGSGMGTLNVFDGSSRVFTQSGDKGNTWHKAEVTVKSNKVSRYAAKT